MTNYSCIFDRQDFQPIVNSLTIDDRLSRILSEGRRVIRLSPIDTSDIELEVNDKGIDNELDAMISAAKTFLLDDMNIPEVTVNQFDVENKQLVIVRGTRLINSQRR